METILHFFPRFFPFSLGGAEFYIKSMILDQQAKGNKVVLLSTFPTSGFDSDSELSIVNFKHHKTATYRYETIDVLCVQPFENNLYDIKLYKRVTLMELEFIEDWKAIFRHYFLHPILKIHVHSLERSFVSLAYLKALKELNPLVSVIAHAHDPVTCKKHTLIKRRGALCEDRASTFKCFFCSYKFENQNGFTAGARVLYIRWQQLRIFLNTLRELDELTDSWIVYSLDMKQNFIRNQLKSKVSVVKHGIDDTFISSPKRSKPNDKINFAFIGRFVQAKGLKMLLDVWSRFPLTRTRALYLIGEANEHTDDTLLKSISEVQDREDIIFLGSKSPSELKEVLQDIHCVIIPSAYQEIGPLVFNEALAMECNVIASNLGGMKEYSKQYRSGSINLFEYSSQESLEKLILNFTYKQFDKLEIYSYKDHFEKLEKALSG